MGRCATRIENQTLLLLCSATGAFVVFFRGLSTIFADADCIRRPGTGADGFAVRAVFVCHAQAASAADLGYGIDVGLCGWICGEG